ncbi:MAG TPA: hypothetical protein VKR42_00805 [Ktedonobacteraceae bacterium]|nr:hypothetical protein [Ktedonobacteraceae bacterium]
MWITVGPMYRAQLDERRDVGVPGRDWHIATARALGALKRTPTRVSWVR